MTKKNKIKKDKLVDEILTIAFTNTDKSVIVRTVGKDGTIHSYASDHFLRKVDEVYDTIKSAQIELVSDMVTGEWRIDCVGEYTLI